MRPLVFTLLVLTGCQAAPPEVYVDSRFANSERTLIQGAANEWERATGGLAQVTLVWDYHLGSLGPGHRTLVRAPNLSVAGRCYREAFDTEEHIYINPDVRTFADTALHELGHHFMAHHVSDPTAVMYGGVSGQESACLIDTDLRSYCRENPCDSNHFFPCAYIP